MFELQYFIIGIVQGFTEFLPISSSGHLVLVSELTSWQDQGLFTDVAVHVGTLLAVIIYLRSHITTLIKSFFSFQRANNDNLIKIIIATIPAVIVGFFIFDFVQLYFRDIKVVAVSSVVFAALLFVADHFKMKISSWQNMSYVQAFIIGAFQILAFDKWKDVLEGATHYHADYVNPKWNKTMKKIVKIDDHIFYKRG